jgi:hypothetical protein
MKKYLVNVSGKNGYSFCVETSSEMAEDNIIGACLDNDLFSDSEDADYASVEPATEDDVLHFSIEGCLFKI